MKDTDSPRPATHAFDAISAAADHDHGTARRASLSTALHFDRRFLDESHRALRRPHHRETGSAWLLPQYGTGALEAAIRQHIDIDNQQLKPLVWIDPVDSIFESPRRLCSRTCDSGHYGSS